jgi:addiction module RelE/StbE family toxin
MRVRWTTDAAEDLEQICDYIARDRPGAARRVADDITKAVGGLSTFPNRGRLGRVEGTRELILAPLPFIAVYEVQTEQVVLLRILHGAQRWPS